jgi:hypothetical protein
MARQFRHKMLTKSSEKHSIKSCVREEQPLFWPVPPSNLAKRSSCQQLAGSPFQSGEEILTPPLSPIHPESYPSVALLPVSRPPPSSRSRSLARRPARVSRRLPGRPSPSRSLSSPTRPGRPSARSPSPDFSCGGRRMSPYWSVRL